METNIQVPKFKIGKRSYNLFPLWITFLLFGITVGGIGAYEVLTKGLQVTGLSNQVPWGLWISIDLSSIALGGSAFVFGVIVYLLRIERFKKVGMLAVLLGFLGYSTAGMVLLFDLGQPFRFWHPIVYWQPHSLLWEITMCVVLYLSVLMAELLPIVLEHPVFTSHPILDKSKFLRNLSNFLQKVSHFLHKAGPVLAVIGLTLSLLHQASLGATYGVLSGRGLWFSPSAPVIFVLSAVTGGSALLFLTSQIVFRVMRPGLVKDEVLLDLARLTGAVALLCIYIRAWDWAVTNYYSFDLEIALQTELLNKVAPYAASFWIGQILFAIIPGFVLLSAKRIKNMKVLSLFAILPMVCTVLTRWNYNLSGLIAQITYDPYTPTVVQNFYSPTWQEWAVGIGVISYWLIAFSLAARFLPFKGEEHHHEEAAEAAA
ncbi:MAG TPA: NrfD/PsrC family molybdoenzyme membrane anchor subunit [Anaerolineales bacterium]|nr:NrfD/PsrC family molybdoenzyme membrane anchor subunit [Anaerolineales bacterium]